MPHIAAAAAAAVAAVAPAGVTAAVATTATATAAKVGFMATMKSVAMKALANYAITAAMSAFQPQVGVAGRPVEWTLNPDGPIPFAAGRVGVAGSVVHKETFGPDLMYYGLVSVLSGSGPIDGYVSFKGDDEFVSFDANGKAITSQWRDEMWLKTTLGNQPDAALTAPLGLKKNATLPGWGASYKLSGKAAYMLVMGENSKRSAYPMGEVKPIHVIRGLRVWDPRLDSTYPGGSGNCRVHDSATWVYSANPYLWAIKWGLGLWEGPTLKGAPAHGSTTDYQVGGIGAKLSGIDVPTLVAAANIADANGWVCAAYPTTDDDKSQVLDAFLQAGGGIYAQRAGKISCIQRAAPRTSIANITAADTAGPIEIDTAASRIDRINTIRPRYWSEAHRWQMQALDDVTAETYRNEDGGTRSRPLDFHYVPAARQAGQLAALQIAHTREGIAGVIPLKPHLQRIKPGDCFTITEPGFVLNGQKFLCLNTEYDPATKVVRVTFVSETDGKYAWALGQDSLPPAPPVLTPVDPTFVSPPLPEDWTISPRPPSPGGGQVPGFDLSGAVSNETATAVLVEYGPTAEGPWKQAYQGPPTVQNIPLDGVQPGATYFVGVRYQRNQNYSDRYVYGPYVAPALVAGDVLPTSPVIQAVNGAIESVDLALNAPVTGLKARTETLYADINAASTGLKDRTNALWADVNTASTGIKARLGVVETNLVDLTSSSASRLTSLETTINTAGTGLVSKVGSLEAATSNLQANMAEASAVNSIAAEVSNARNGKANLSAELSSMRMATSDGLAQKASASQVSVIEAKVASMQAVKLPSRPSVAADYTGNGFGTPETRPDWTAGTNVLVPSEGTVREFTGRQLVLSKGWLPVGVGRTFRVTLRTRVTVDAPGIVQNVGFVSFNESGSATVNVLGFDQAQSVSNGWITRTVERTSEQLGGVWVRARADLNRHPVNGSAPATSQLAVLTIEDVTEAASIAARTAQLETATANLQAGKADASRAAALEATVNTAGTGLVAKVGALETATSNLQTGKAEASSLAALVAKSVVLSNLIDNPSGAYEQRGWIKLGTLAWQGTSAQIGPYFEAGAGHQWATQFYPYEAGALLSLGYNGTCEGVGGLFIQFLIDGVYTNRPTLLAAGQDWSVRRESSAPASMPSGGQFRIVSTVASGTLRFSNVMVNAGPVPAAYRDDYSARSVSAGMAVHTNAIADLQSGKASAGRVASLEATVNTPGTGVVARLTTVETVSADADGRSKASVSLIKDVNGYISGHGSSNDGTTATFFVLADVFGLVDPDGTHGTEFREGCWHLRDAAENTRTRYGKAFGGTQKLVWWTGPSSVAEGSESKANAYVYISMNTTGGPRFGGSDVPSGGGGGGTGGAAMANELINGSIGSGGFQTLAMASFTNRPSAGWWSATVGGLSGSSDGFADNTLEFRIIEQGASVPYATGTATVPAGMTSMIELAFNSAGPWPQSQSAGTVTLLLQARRTGGDGMATFASGRFTASYTPGV